MNSNEIDSTTQLCVSFSILISANVCGFFFHSQNTHTLNTLLTTIFRFRHQNSGNKAFLYNISNVILLWSDARLLILTKLKVLEKYPKISHTHFKPHRLRNIFGLEWPKSHKNAKIENGHFALNIDLSKTRGNKQKTTKNKKNREVWEEFYSTC